MSIDKSIHKEVSPLYGERSILEGKLVTFKNPAPYRNYEIDIKLPEFTCKCPFSGYPDFAILKLIYQPNEFTVELKSLKLYINSFRECKISHEEVTNKILDDLVDSCEPHWMQLEADFNPRGNVHTIIRVSYGKKKED